MANSKIIDAKLTDNLLLELEEGMPTNSQERDQYGNISPQLNIISARNIMPTRHGYTSFFGTDDLIISTDTTLKGVQDIISYRTVFGETVLFALCEDGVYLRSMLGDDILASVVETATEITIQGVRGKCSWKRGCYSKIASPNLWKLWSVVILENNLYFYQKGMDYIARFRSSDAGIWIFDKLDPSYIISAVPAAFSYDITAYQTFGNSTYKSIDVGFGRTSIYFGSSTTIYNYAEKTITLFNKTNDGIATLALAAPPTKTVTPMQVTITADTIPADLAIHDIYGNVVPWIISVVDLSPLNYSGTALIELYDLVGATNFILYYYEDTLLTRAIALDTIWDPTLELPQRIASALSAAMFSCRPQDITGVMTAISYEADDPLFPAATYMRVTTAWRIKTIPDPLLPTSTGFSYRLIYTTGGGQTSINDFGSIATLKIVDYTDYTMDIRITKTDGDLGMPLPVLYGKYWTVTIKDYTFKVLISDLDDWNAMFTLMRNQIRTVYPNCSLFTSGDLRINITTENLIDLVPTFDGVTPADLNLTSWPSTTITVTNMF